MARRYVNPAVTAPRPVPDKALDEARERAAAASERFRQAEAADPAVPGWGAEYEAAAVGERSAARQLERLEELRAEQVERVGQRAAAVKSAAAEMKAMAATLAKARAAVTGAAAGHLKALAALEAACDEHNVVLAAARARLTDLGLRVTDDLVADGGQHDEGAVDPAGVLVAGLRCVPVPAAGVAAHACRQVFGRLGPRHPLGTVGKYGPWRPFEVEARADGLAVPSLEDAGLTRRPAPPVVHAARASHA